MRSGVVRRWYGHEWCISEWHEDVGLAAEEARELGATRIEVRYDTPTRLRPGPRALGYGLGVRVESVRATRTPVLAFLYRVAGIVACCALLAAITGFIDGGQP